MHNLNKWYWQVCGALAILFFLFWFFILRNLEYTNDAYVQGNQVYTMALTPGFVSAIYTDDTFLVRKGQLLVELDPTDSIIALKTAKEQLAKTVREICQAFHQVYVYQAEIEIEKAELTKAEQDFKHRQGVINIRGVSLEDYQHAVDALNARRASLLRTKRLYQRAWAFVQGTSIKQHPLVKDAAARLEYAWVQLYRCKIYAPVTGLVAQRKIQVGMWVNQNEPMMSVIPLDQIWVNANFKETQLTRMRIGQKVKVVSDLYGRNVVYHGRIVGLPGAAGNAFSLLPPQNLSGNWIKIVQRLPVRVAIPPKEIIAHPLRIGLSMEATAYLNNQEGPIVPTKNNEAPNYITDIYLKEVEDHAILVNQIIEENLDPTLKQFAENTFNLPGIPFDEQVT